MKIGEIRPGMNDVNTTGEVTRISKPTFNTLYYYHSLETRYEELAVAEATLEDETGSITLLLWQDEIDKVKTGDFLTVDCGLVTTWNDKPLLNITRKKIVLV
jgi:ssDNA-binding replication factor A large subunit